MQQLFVGEIRRHRRERDQGVAINHLYCFIAVCVPVGHYSAVRTWFITCINIYKEQFRIGFGSLFY